MVLSLHSTFAALVATAVILQCVITSFDLKKQVSLRQQHQQQLHLPTSTAISTRQSMSRLFSFGDPDISSESNFYRYFQNIARNVDAILFPEETDIPGVTFLSPVEWAPWMETIWFGNAYDYRSAFFHDVMYSNNKPGREGALLYRDSYKALMIALLYQRYKRFDISSYSLPNATFFNVFGTESLRVGRYKVPLTDDVILCITDPLTFSETKRYLNSFNAVKWFRSQFFQQKRKRQYILNIASGTDTSSLSSLTGQKPLPITNSGSSGNNGIFSQFSSSLNAHTISPLSSASSNSNSNSNSKSISSNFFHDAIYTIEYGRMDMAVSNALPATVASSHLKRLSSVTIPIQSLPLSSLQEIRIENDSNAKSTASSSDGSTLVFPMKIANSQYILESLFQSILNHISRQYKAMAQGSFQVLVGGDGRLLNDLAVETFCRVAVGNRVKNLLTVNENLLTTPVAEDILHLWKSSSNSGSNSKADPSGCTGVVAVVLTAGEERGGIRGSFGVKVFIQPITVTCGITDTSTSTTSSISFSKSDWFKIINKMLTMKMVKISPKRIDPSSYLLTSSSLSKQQSSLLSSSILGLSTSTSSTSSSTTYDVIDAVVLKSLQQDFDLKKIKSFLDSSGLIVSIDFMHSAAVYSNYASLLLNRLGIDDGSFLNTDYIASSSSSSSSTSKNSEKAAAKMKNRIRSSFTGDFNGYQPSVSNVAAAKDSLSLFSVCVPSKIITPMTDVEDVIQSLEGSNEDEDDNSGDDKDYNLQQQKVKTNKKVNTSNYNAIDKGPNDFDGCPDIGFVLNADGSDCRVLGPGIAVTPRESQIVINEHDVKQQHGVSSTSVIRVILSWLEILADKNEKLFQNNNIDDEIKLVGVMEILQEVWKKHGKEMSLTLKMDTDLFTASQVFARLSDVATAVTITTDDAKSNAMLSSNNTPSTVSSSNETGTTASTTTKVLETVIEVSDNNGVIGVIENASSDTDSDDDDSDDDDDDLDSDIDDSNNSLDNDMSPIFDISSIKIKKQASKQQQRQGESSSPLVLLSSGEVRGGDQKADGEQNKKDADRISRGDDADTDGDDEEDTADLYNKSESNVDNSSFSSSTSSSLSSAIQEDLNLVFGNQVDVVFSTTPSVAVAITADSTSVTTARALAAVKSAGGNEEKLSQIILPDTVTLRLIAVTMISPEEFAHSLIKPQPKQEINGKVSADANNSAVLTSSVGPSQELQKLFADRFSELVQAISMATMESQIDCYFKPDSATFEQE